MASQFDNEPMPAAATRNLFMWASGFGIGALLILAAFVFLIGVGEVGQGPHTNSQATPAGQSAANAPVAPGPAPKPAPNTAAPAVPSGQAPSTTGQAPAPAEPSTARAPTQNQQQQPQQKQ